MPPPHFGVHFRKNDQKTIGFLSKSEKVKSLLECPESHFSFLLIKPMGFWSFSKKAALSTYCLIITGGPERGRVGGPFGGPVAVSAFRVVHRICEIPEIFPISMKFRNFPEFPVFS